MRFIRILPLFIAVAVAAADRPQIEFPLWSGKAPGQRRDAARDIPTLTPFWSPKPTGAAIVICPSGGYGGLAAHEGKGYADWLTT